MPSFLVLSSRHELTPFAWCLHMEGHPVEAIPWAKRYEKAWAGGLDSILKGQARSEENLRPVVEAAARGEIVVLSSHPKWQDRFAGAALHYPTLPAAAALTPHRLGSWFDGEQHHARHLWAVDLGAWPGGLGPQVEGAGALIADPLWPKAFEDALQTTTDPLKAQSYRGLVEVAVRPTADLSYAVLGWRAGWHGLHGHAFLAALGDEPLAAVLTGATPRLTRRITLVAPLTVPPWPLQCNVPSAEVEVGGLTPQQRGQVFWHDVRLDREAKKLWVAGLDGLVGVVWASADSFELARSRVLRVACKAELPEKQFRPDAGEVVPNLLAGLEETFA